jgi:hypothetical protein
MFERCIDWARQQSTISCGLKRLRQVHALLICNALAKRELRYFLRFQYVVNGEVAAIAATAAIVAQ